MEGKVRLELLICILDEDSMKDSKVDFDRFWEVPGASSTLFYISAPYQSMAEGVVLKYFGEDEVELPEGLDSPYDFRKNMEELKKNWGLQDWSAKAISKQAFIKAISKPKVHKVSNNIYFRRVKYA